MANIMNQSDINNLLLLMNEYKENIKNNHQELEDYKETINKAITKIIEREIDTSENNPRLQAFLEKTKISDLNFLYRSLHYMRGNNEKGFLTTEKLLLLNEETKQLAANYDITTERQLFFIFIDHFYHHKTHPLLNEKKIISFHNRFQTLAYLDEFFKDVSNCLAFQGSFTTYKYVKNYLKDILTEEKEEDDNALLNKDLKAKTTIVTENLVPIANELLTLRNSIPNSRISVCNQGLRKTAQKRPGSQITFEQQVFIDAIAFGTTLEKLENKNYEDAKKMLYLPHQRITK